MAEKALERPSNLSATVLPSISTVSTVPGKKDIGVHLIQHEFMSHRTLRGCGEYGRDLSL